MSRHKLQPIRPCFRPVEECSPAVRFIPSEVIQSLVVVVIVGLILLFNSG